MLRMLAKEKGFEADGVTYSMLVQGFGRQGRRKEGEAVLDEMLDLGFIPNIAAYNRLLDTLHMGRSLQLQENFSRHVKAPS